MAAAGKTNMLTGMVMIGISAGCQPLLSYNVGAGDRKRTIEILKDMLLLSCGLGVFFAVLCFVLREPLVGLFLKEEGVKEIAVGLVPYLMIGSPFLGFYYVATAYLQAEKKATAAIVTSVLRQGAILIPMLYLMHALFGLIGIAAAHTVSDIASSVLAVVITLAEGRSNRKRSEENC